MKILIIEDNPQITEPLSMIIKSKGHECTVTHNGMDGLRLIKEQKWDYVLQDLAMPDFSGLDVINSLEQDGLLAENKIVVFTASSVTDSERDELVRRGVHGYLRKPCKVEDILAKFNIE